MEIRSYRRVFELERRIYRVDRLRLNPNGVPVRGVVYFLALLAGSMLAARLPVGGLVAGVIPWYARDLALPGLLAALLAVVRIDGRPFHLAAHALIGFRSRPRRLVRLRRQRGPDRSVWTPAPIAMVPDGSDSRIRRLRYTGPGIVRVAVAHELCESRGPLVGAGLRTHLRLHARADRDDSRRTCPEIVVLARGTRLSAR